LAAGANRDEAVAARTRAGSSLRPRVAFAFPNPRARLLAAVERGEAPDSTLLGLNHLTALGIDAYLHDPVLTRRGKPGGAPGRAVWYLRELVLPWELRKTDLVFTPLAQLFPLAARLRPRLPVVAVNYGLCTAFDRSSGPRKRQLAASLRSCAGVVCLGEAQRRHLIERMGLAPERVAAIPLGIDAAFFSGREESRSGESHVLSVGKDLARDYGTLVEALEPLDTPARLIAHPRNVAGIALPESARVLSVSDIELRDQYAGAACVVVSQQPDGYPLGSEAGGLTALLEAMAMAKPIVVSERAILSEYVVDGETALVVPPRDPARLRQAIEKLLSDRELAARLGQAARRRVEERHTMPLWAAALAPVLRAASRLRRA
jgi:glycosyltransferase involved in cell wall biosynthesis